MTQPTSPSTHPQTAHPSLSARDAALRSILEDMAAPLTINIDPEGDLLLDATADPSSRKRFRVCSYSLRRQSPVWKRMLFGPWKESKPANKKPWVVELPFDPVYPLEIILSIIHSKFNVVPAYPSLQTIHQLLVMANKYDVTSIVRPWCSQWQTIACFHSPTMPADVIRSLYIAWELGDDQLFLVRLEQICLNTALNSTGRLIYAGQFILETEDFLGPQTALETISKIRLDLLEKLISPVHEVLDARMKEQPVCTESSYSKKAANRTCDAAVIGNIYREMIQTRGGILSRSASDIQDSVVGLASWIFSFMARTEGTHEYSYGTRPKCSPQSTFGSLNSTIHNGIPDVVAGFMKPSYNDYMAKQRTKTGLVPSNWQNRFTNQNSRYWKYF